MVVRKPYAFLIKKFKLIHFIMFALLVYIMIGCYNIFSFFNSYASSTYVATVDYTITSISFFLYLACILVIIISLIIYFLLKEKNKPFKFYIFTAVYYSVIIIYLILILAQIKDMSYNTFGFEKVRFIRDICLLTLIPQVFPVFFVLSRALGFNIKNFDFQKDISGLDISDEDAAEIELNLGSNSYKYKRGLRRLLRYTKYFVLENKFFVTIVGSVSALIITLFVVVNVKQSILYYNKQESFIANSIYYSVIDSYIVDDDTHDNVINKGYYYLLIKVNLKNRTSNQIYLDRDTFRLLVNNEMLFPKFNFNEEFIDVGEVFAPFTLEAGTKKDILLVYELNEEQIKSEYILKVKNNNLSIDKKYIDVLVNANILKDKNVSNKYVMGSTIDFRDTVLDGLKLRVNGFDIQKSYKEEYQVCDNNECENYINIVKPKNNGNYILRIDSTVTNNGFNSLNFPNDFYKYFVFVNYRTYGNVYKMECDVIDSDVKSNYTYIEVPQTIIDYNKLELVINNRENKYTLVLK